MQPIQKTPATLLALLPGDTTVEPVLRCPRCGGIFLHNKGKTNKGKGSKKYQCKGCQKVFTENPLGKFIPNNDWQSEYEKDIWDVRNFGLEGHKTSAQYKLNFTPLCQPWLRRATKEYIQYSLATLTFNAARNRLQGIQRFARFLTEPYPNLTPLDISRSVVIDFLSYLAKAGLSEQTRIATIGSLRTFLELCSQYKWAEFPKELLVYQGDYPKLKKPLPKFIPQDVLDQLNQHLDDLPESVMRMVLVLQECGMRITELCLLSFNCLMQDNHGDWFLNYYQFKMKKEIVIPVSKELVAVIKEQQKYIRSNIDCKFSYLFSARKAGGTLKDFIPNSKPMLCMCFANYLNRLATDKQISDSTGSIWHFHAHQFRHTVGTRMINNGVPQHIIQRYLGHESPEMTAVYAHIFPSTLKKEFAEYQGRVVNVAGQIIESENPELDTTDLQWFKRNVQAQALPNGSCARPIVKGPCPHANACLTCGDFRTTKEFLGIHHEELENTQKIIEKAKTNGWQRQVEMNEQVKTNLQNIISVLESDNAKNG